MDEALKKLDRVKVMRAFDYAGLQECVQEVESSRQLHESGAATEQESDMQAEIPNSQDELDFSEDDSPSKALAQPESSKTQILIIDNVTNIMGPELSKNQIQGLQSIFFHPSD